MAIFQHPPTEKIPLDIDQASGQATFDPHWLNWFLTLAAILNNGTAFFRHNSLPGLQGGDGVNFYHLDTFAYDALLGTGLGFTTPSFYHSHNKQPTNRTVLPVSGSPQTFTNGTNYMIYYTVTGGTVSLIQYVVPSVVTVTLPGITGVYPVFPSDQIKITYTVAPTVISLNS